MIEAFLNTEININTQKQSWADRKICEKNEKLTMHSMKALVSIKYTD